MITKTGVGLLFYESSEMYAEKVDKKVYFIEFDLWLNSTDTTIFHTVHQFPLLKEDFNYTSCYASLNKDTFIFNSPYGNCQFVYDLIWTPRLNSYTYVDVLTGVYYKQSINESVQLNSSVGEYWVISNVNSKFEHFSIVKNMLFYNTPLGIKVFDLKKRENIEFNYNDKELDASLRIEDGIYYESNKFVTIIRKVRK